jgi:murein DD-endopeptidase MepM/ murein hydrolase activator NlpD
LSRQKVEFSKLRHEKEQQSEYHQRLQKKERELRDLLRQQRQVEERLQKEIERLIAEEAKRAMEKRQLSDNFERNKGKFPWPVSQGVITDRFGEHPHPVMKNIIIRNNGIDITTSPGEQARSIFNGIVSRVFAVPGGNMAVIIRHGQFITVYSNLKEVLVKQGDQVVTSQNIGIIYSDPNEEDKTVLKFQIWKENVKLNPELWISK